MSAECSFMGALANNTNLAVKGILAIGAYAQLRAMAGDAIASAKYIAIARSYTAFWLVHAHDGDHYRMAYAINGSWSQKYNLIWDRILGLGLFPASVSRKEVEFYGKQMEKYG